jgi:predicted porin
MKKTLIAFAALSAIAGMAQAQSSVTLYGLVDAYIGQTQTETNGPTAATSAPKVKQTVVNSSGQNNSRWGVRGTEDLGGGLKAVFQLEGGFNTDNGSFAQVSPQGGSLFGRQAFVGVSGGFGTVSLGRQYTAYDALRGATNQLYDSNFATVNGTAAVANTTAGFPSLWDAGLADYTNRASNSIAYASPSFAGFSGGAVYGFGENKRDAVGAVPGADAESNASIRIQYANGPLLVGYAHQQEKRFVGSSGFFTAPASAVSAPPVLANAFSSTRKYDLIGASYDFGVVKVTGSYNRAEGQTGATTVAGVTPRSKDDEFQIGVSVPFGPAAIAAGYSYAKTDGNGGTSVGENKSDGVSLLGTYSLSKRTNVYAGFRTTKVESVNATVETKASLVAVGVRHLF